MFQISWHEYIAEFICSKHSDGSIIRMYGVPKNLQDRKGLQWFHCRLLLWIEFWLENMIGFEFCKSFQLKLSDGSGIIEDWSPDFRHVAFLRKKTHDKAIARKSYRKSSDGNYGTSDQWHLKFDFHCFPIYIFWDDINSSNLMLFVLQNNHNMPFFPTSKDDSCPIENMFNVVRAMDGSNKVRPLK